MISRRLVVNLIVFFLVSFALVAYGVVNLLGNPLQSPTTLTTEFPNASGLYPGFEVELNGVPVGTVSSTSLTASATKVTMSIDPGIEVPRDVQSSVQIANDLGEQVVNLVPAHGGSVPDLQSGATVPAAPNQVPADVGAVVASATRLLRAIPADDLNTLIGELATSLAGRAGDLRTLISAGTTFSKEFVAYQQQFTELLANAPPSLDAVTAVAPALRQDLANTAALVQVLAQQKSGLHTLFTSGSSAFGEVTTSSRRSPPTSAASCTTRPTPSRTSPNRPTWPTSRRVSPPTSTSSVRSRTSRSRVWPSRPRPTPPRTPNRPSCARASCCRRS